LTILQIGQRSVGDGRPAFIIAEIGINHNGDINLAHRLIDQAAEAHCDAVKFQNYRTEDFIFDRSLVHKYVSQGIEVSESQFELFKRCELSPSTFAELAEHCKGRGIMFLSTPTSEKGIRELIDLGAPALKNGSDYLVNLPLIRAMGQTGLPCILSTGMGTLDEITEALHAFRDGGGKDVILLVCTSLYPAVATELHLRRIPAMAAKFGVSVGLSDHSEGILAALGAVALGACVVEKHFTLDKRMPGPDHRFSADPTELRLMVESIRTLEIELGDPTIGPTRGELKTRNKCRLSCVAATNLKSGYSITEADIAFARPGTGFPPKIKERLVGCRLVRDITRGHVFASEDFEG